MINHTQISKAADALLDSLVDEALIDPIHWLSKERQSIPMKAADKLPIREPTRIPKKLPPISFFRRVKDAARDFVGKAKDSYNNRHPDSLPISSKAVDDIKLQEPKGPAGPLTGKPQFRSTVRPPHRDRLIRHGAHLVKSHVHSKSFPGVSFPTPYVEPGARHELPKAQKPLDMRKVRRTRTRNAIRRKMAKYGGAKPLSAKTPVPDYPDGTSMALPPVPSMRLPSKHKQAAVKPRQRPKQALGRKLADMNQPLGSMGWVDQMLGK